MNCRVIGGRLPMMRFGLATAVLMAALGIGCSGGDAGSPTSPTPSTPTTGEAGGQSPTNPSCVPAAPGNLQVAVNASTRVFTWNAVSGVQDYFIQIGSASGSSNLINTNTTQTTYTWTGGGAGTFFARVYGRNSCGSGPSSTEVVFN
jgi:hypothetical protein